MPQNHILEVLRGLDDVTRKETLELAQSRGREDIVESLFGILMRGTGQALQVYDQRRDLMPPTGLPLLMDGEARLAADAMRWQPDTAAGDMLYL